MRLIDADALLEVARGHLSLFDSCPGKIGLTDKIRRDEIQNSIADILNAPTVAASPWHMVDEPPESACDCLVCWTTIHDEETGEVTGHGFWWEKGWYEDGLLGEVGFYCQGRLETHPTRVEPDYWMPIEPPKEDA